MTTPRKLTKRFDLLGHPGFYLEVVLWPSQAAMNKAFGDDDSQCRGRYQTPKIYAKKALPEQMGTIHLYRHEWGERSLSHELTHLAFFWRDEFKAKHVNPQVKADYKGLPPLLLLDEAVCHSVGSAFRNIFAWLWKVNPPEAKQ
jgi:hypothetical protein